MITALKNVISTITTLCQTMNRGASALDHWAKWAEGEAEAFEQQATHERQARKELAQAKLGVLPKPS